MFKKLKMNLQYFSSNEAGDQGGDQDGTLDYSDLPDYEGGIEPLENEGKFENPYTEDSYQDESQTQIEDQQQAQDQAQSDVQEFDFGGRKVRPGDPESIRGIYQDWQNQQQYIQQLQQQTKEYQQMLDYMRNTGALPNQQSKPQDPYATSQPSSERMEELHEEYMNRMYENVFEAQRWLHQQPEYQEFMREQLDPIVRPYVEPIQQERQYQQQIQQMQDKYQDFDQYIPQMQELLNQRPEIGNREDALEMVYFMAKGQMASQQPTPDQLLNDPGFQQQIIQNENIRNQILGQHLQNKQNQMRNTPPVMGRNPNGVSPMYKEQAPRSIAEGSKAFRRALGINN